jgi:hypothetical protein
VVSDLDQALFLLVNASASPPHAVVLFAIAANLAHGWRSDARSRRSTARPEPARRQPS